LAPQEPLRGGAPLRRSNLKNRFQPVNIDLFDLFDPFDLFDLPWPGAGCKVLGAGCWEPTCRRTTRHYALRAVIGLTAVISLWRGSVIRTSSVIMLLWSVIRSFGPVIGPAHRDSPLERGRGCVQDLHAVNRSIEPGCCEAPGAEAIPKNRFQPVNITPSTLLTSSTRQAYTGIGKKIKMCKFVV